ncbi:MAG: EamA family transporter RarD [Paracoccaceae bacterium]|nr:EamA family transporter RarD [Paracoccaceae bacterium]
MTEAGKGVGAMALACTIWGLSPLYYKLLTQVPSLELLSHRTLWSLVFFGVLLAMQGRLALVPRLLASGALPVVTLAAVMISVNWFLFIHSVQIGKTVEASLGYYIFPLVAVMIGMIAFGERLSRGQGLAVGLALGAVVVLTLGLGVAPWISLALAFTFGVYGLVKKRLSVGPVVSVTAEILVLSPLAALWLLVVHGGDMVEFGRPGGWFGRDLQTSALLAFSGVLTAGPLILFSYATRRISMATVGLVQYLNPTLQFLCAVLVFAEPFTRWHGLAFAMIWAALAVYSWESLRIDRRIRNSVQPSAAHNRSVSAGTSGTSVK